MYLGALCHYMLPVYEKPTKLSHFEGSDTIPNHVGGFRNLHESCQESWNHRNLKKYKSLDYP